MTYVKGMVAAACLVVATAMAEAQGLGFATFLASVSATGAISFSSGVTASAHQATGHYVITFARDVSQCVVVPTRRGTGGGQTSVNQPPATPTKVHIYTFTTTGAAVDANFAVMVSCNSGT